MNADAELPPGERLIWRGSASQWLNFPLFVLCGLTFWLVVPIFVALYKYLQTRTTVYEVTSERLRRRHGIFSRRLDELELYRVRDTTLVEPFFQRLVGLATIELTTADASTPTLTLRGISGAAALREELRTSIEAARQRKRVRSMELE